MNDIPEVVIGRLPIYLRALTHLAEAGQMKVSSRELCKRLGISSAQIRKDFSHFGEFGKQGSGYNVRYLVQQLRYILQLNEERRVAIVGAGYLGHALAHYQGFASRGFHICAVFDVDPKRIGEVIDGIEVIHFDHFVEIAKREKIEFVILAVPAYVAQTVTDLLVGCGIKAILNYAPIHLNVPPSVQVRDSDPLIQMQEMSYYLNRES